jgi:hypothetical protein
VLVVFWGIVLCEVHVKFWFEPHHLVSDCIVIVLEHPQRAKPTLTISIHAFLTVLWSNLLEIVVVKKGL